MKKSLVGLVLLLSLVLSGFTTTNVTASEVTYYEEKTFEESYQDAVNGVSDIPLEHINISNEMKAFTQDEGVAEDLKITEYKTAQILEESDSEQFIAVTVFNDVNILEDTDGPPEIMPFGDKGSDKWDSSGGVKSYSRIYYKTKVEGGVTYATLTKVTGGWTNSDSSIKLSNRKVVYGVSGWPGVSKKLTVNPSTNSYNASFSWPYVATSTTYHLGTNSTVTLKRGSSTWTLYHLNNASSL
ncbi:hypothetical protein [Cytobacillus kochii]|uniref:hypothetical protein n=1 Tax=Cytobacillus kochii TaxID=859143 RepID=UPI00203AF6BC|nr:hypothetical protein [Cytobacillus kochii]MCM3324770.1 hypothetical protein [Cytobacillus kochii]MCM3347163.1 hypothetical protein [Cytobacillus kochii]